jgi:leader peptidase (prepilin peptidase)/N-methyltransferase
MTVFVASALGAVTFLGVVYPITWLRRTHTRDQTELALGGAPFAAPLVPFGVFLAPAAMLTLLWGETWLGWLLGS